MKNTCDLSYIQLAIPHISLSEQILMNYFMLELGMDSSFHPSDMLYFDYGR